MPGGTIGGDDLQTQLLLRDQLQQAAACQQQQQQYAMHAGQQPDHRATSSLSMASSMAALGTSAHHHHGLMGSQPAKPASLAKAVAALLANSQDWKERVDRMNALADALNRQVRGVFCSSAAGRGTWSC